MSMASKSLKASGCGTKSGSSIPVSSSPVASAGFKVDTLGGSTNGKILARAAISTCKASSVASSNFFPSVPVRDDRIELRYSGPRGSYFTSVLGCWMVLIKSPKGVPDG